MNLRGTKMMRKSLVILLAVFVISSLFVVGCKERTEPEVQAISKEEAKQAAEKDINEANLDAELQKMQDEIGTDQ